MEFETFEGNLAELEADLLVLILNPSDPFFHLDHELLEERIAGVQNHFRAGSLRREYCLDPAGLAVQQVVVYSPELEKLQNLWENIKTFASRGYHHGTETARPRIAFALNSEAGLEQVGRVVEGIILGAYRFDKYRSSRTPDHPCQVVIWTQSSPQAQAQIERAQSFCQATNRVRDLVNESGGVATPAFLKAQSEQIAGELGLNLEVWDRSRLQQEARVGLVTVGGGSQNPPYMLSLSYLPPTPSPVHLVLLGKGVTFDSGGLSIKPADKMHLMRGDMAGAAAVLGAMQLIGQLKPEIRVTGVLVCAENAPDGRAMRPGDILVYRNGKSVHIENTDAEGRLILADGLIYAGEIAATHIVDVATLTGAAARALGPAFSAIMGNNRSLVNAISRAGGNHGEAYWKLPLPAEYKEMLKSSVADLNNLGGPAAGASTAGLFLQEFVPPGAAWAHLDIASTFWREKPAKYFGEGATGVATRTLAELASDWAAFTA